MKQGIGWPGRFIAEFVVIVVGVLVALGVDAVWSDREEREIEALYLEQILGDLRVTEAALDTAVTEYRTALEGSLAVVAAVNRVPPVWGDSTTALLLGSGSVPVFTAVMGTIDGLIEGGDLALLRSPVVRTALLRYRGAVENLEAVSAVQSPLLLRAFERIGASVSMAMLLDTGHGLRGNIRWQELAADPAFGSDLAWIYLSLQNTVVALEQVEEELSAAIDAVEGG